MKVVNKKYKIFPKLFFLDSTTLQTGQSIVEIDDFLNISKVYFASYFVKNENLDNSKFFNIVDANVYPIFNDINLMKNIRNFLINSNAKMLNNLGNYFIFTYNNVIFRVELINNKFAILYPLKQASSNTNFFIILSNDTNKIIISEFDSSGNIVAYQEYDLTSNTFTQLQSTYNTYNVKYLDINLFYYFDGSTTHLNQNGTDISFSGNYKAFKTNNLIYLLSTSELIIYDISSNSTINQISLTNSYDSLIVVDSLIIFQTDVTSDLYYINSSYNISYINTIEDLIQPIGKLNNDIILLKTLNNKLYITNPYKLKISEKDIDSNIIINDSTSFLKLKDNIFSKIIIEDSDMIQYDYTITDSTNTGIKNLTITFDKLDDTLKDVYTINVQLVNNIQFSDYTEFKTFVLDLSVDNSITEQIIIYNPPIYDINISVK